MRCLGVFVGIGVLIAMYVRRVCGQGQEGADAMRLCGSQSDRADLSDGWFETGSG